MMKYFVIGLCLLSLVFADQDEDRGIRFEEKCDTATRVNCNKRRLLLEDKIEQHALRKKPGPPDRKLLGDSSQDQGRFPSYQQQDERWRTVISSGALGGDRKLLAKKEGLARVISNEALMDDDVDPQSTGDRKLLGDSQKDTGEPKGMLNIRAMPAFFGSKLQDRRKLLSDPLQEGRFPSDQVEEGYHASNLNRQP